MVDIAVFALAATLRQFYVDLYTSTALGLIMHKHGRGWAHSRVI